MIITVVGSHGTGKSTLLKELFNYYNKDHECILTSEVARACPYQINKGLPEAQRWIEEEYFNIERGFKGEAFDNWLVFLDRCLMDVFIYDAFYYNYNTKNYIDVAKQLIGNYDIVIWARNTDFWEDDLVRMSKERQIIIDKLYERLFEGIEVIEYYDDIETVKMTLKMKLSNEDEEIVKDLIYKYGEHAQIDLAVEEMAELTQSLMKYKRSFLDGKQDHINEIKDVIEEMVDVQIMMEQLKIIFDVDYNSDVWDENWNLKMDRLKQLKE